MAKPIRFVYLVLVFSHFMNLPTAYCQSSNWMILDENYDPDEKGAELSNSVPGAIIGGNFTKPCNQTTHDEQFCKCAIRICLDPEEYVMVNETAHVEAYNATYNSSFYEIDGNCLRICAPDFFYQREEEKGVFSGKYSTALTYITIIGLAISMLCLVLHLIAFVVIPDLRNIPGYCMACLCVSLLAGYTSFLVGFDNHILNSKGPCIATAASTHFFLLSSVLWMNVMAYDVLNALLNAIGKLRVKSPSFSFKNFYMYCLYSWGVALVFAVIAVVADLVPNFPEGYRPYFGQDLCWFRQKKALLVFFAAPVFTVICMNVLFFGLSAYIIVSNRMKTNDPHLKRNLVMYVRLAIIMGLTWVSGLLAGIIDAVFLWYIFAVLNTLQGFFIFLAFTCTPKVKKRFSTKRFSGQTVSPTFRSHSNGKAFENGTVIGNI